MTASALSHSFSLRKAAKLCGLQPGRLQYWVSTGLVQPSGEGRERFTFGDIVSIRVAKRLTDQGASLQDIRATIVALRTLCPKLTNPLAEMQVQLDEGRIVVQQGPRWMELGSGQYVFHFEGTQQAQVRPLSGASSGRTARASSSSSAAPNRTPRATVHALHGARDAALDHYVRGCKLEASADTLHEALREYQQAVTLDEHFAPAWVNLGNLWYRGSEHDEATLCYQRALELEPAQPEALYNFAVLLYENGCLKEAATLWRRLIEFHDDYAEGHFMLALACEELGNENEARTHWERFLVLEPNSPWTEVARQHL